MAVFYADDTDTNDTTRWFFEASRGGCHPIYHANDGLSAHVVAALLRENMPCSEIMPYSCCPPCLVCNRIDRYLLYMLFVVVFLLFTFMSRVRRGALPRGGSCQNSEPRGHTELHIVEIKIFWLN